MTQDIIAAPPKPTSRLLIDGLVCLALVGLTAYIYTQTVYHEFVNYDDDAYVSENPQVRAGLTLHSIAWALTTGDCSNWHPVTWVSHLLDYQLFGLNPGRHHLVSAIIHALNGALLYWVLLRATRARWPSALTAALFVVHPLHVESVAWIAERKDVVSAFFWFLTMLVYIRYTERPGLARYALVLAVFALGLMAKPMLVTLPVILLLLDFWPLDRVASRGHVSKRPSSGWGRLVLEKIPLLVLSVAASIVTFLVQRRAASVQTFEAFPFTVRVENAIVSYVRYLSKTVWPHPLVVYYPHPGANLPGLLVAGSALVLLAITLTAWSLRRRRYLLVGWLWYVGALIPVIGLIQVGTQAMADRYTYIPLIGIFIMVAWGLEELIAGNSTRRAAATFLSAGVILGLSIVAWRQVGYWKNSVMLFTHAVQNTKNNAVAYGNLADAEFKLGDLAQAEIYAGQALRIAPNNATALITAGAIELRKGNVAPAAEYLSRAIAFAPTNPRAHNNYAGALANLGKLDEAIAHLEEALRLDPGYENARKNLENLQRMTGKRGN